MANTPKSSYVFPQQVKNKIKALKELDELQTDTAVLINLVNKEYKARKEELEAAGIKAERVTNNK